jgi:DNA repair exonuclease SbcCD ATPase subunit
MISFEKLRWKNILSTGNSFTEIALNSHKTSLIVGENGAGKSTILDALCFVLYGKPFRKVKKAQLLNSINGKGLMVEIEFKIGKRSYHVKRGIKPNVFEVYVDGTLIDQLADAREYQDMLEKQILKLNYRSFSQIVILGSAAYMPFMQLPAAHRREIIEDLLDIQIFSVMNVLLKDKQSANKIRIGDADYEIKSSADKIELYNKHIGVLKQNNEDLVAQKEQLMVKYREQVSTAQAEIDRLHTEVSTQESSISDHTKIRSRHEKLVTLQRQIDSKFDKIKRDVFFFHSNDDCPTCRQGIAEDHKHDIVSKAQVQMDEIDTGRQQITDELAKIDARIAEIGVVVSSIAQCSRQASELNVQIRTWNNFIKGIEDEITELKSNTKQIDDNTTEVNQLKMVLSTAIKDKEVLSNERNLYDVASLLLKDGGIKTKIIKQYIPIINKLINKYLAAMDFFVNFELNENFEETIKSRFRDEFTYDSFSEGEKLRIDLALLFAWRAVAKLRNSASTNLLIMDEVFDSSLDSTGTDEFMKILNGVASDTNTFIISHKGDQLADKFEHTIKFEKYKNFSRIASVGG